MGQLISSGHKHMQGKEIHKQEVKWNPQTRKPKMQRGEVRSEPSKYVEVMG